jgi:hypothetical protein
VEYPDQIVTFWSFYIYINVYINVKDKWQISSRLHARCAEDLTILAIFLTDFGAGLF